ncbi:MAG: hypothetical protein JNM52_06900, partial [Betaproteobacteria bacterium]|nr:hypothetical protein [Betaproteobacteria bacterium]
MNARALPPLAHATTAILVAILGLQLAAWCWHFAGPLLLSRLMPARSAAAAAADTQAVDLSMARKLFGGEPISANPAASFAGELRLKGVFAVDGKSLSAAIINAGGRDLVVFL